MGFAALMMPVALASGVVMHRKIFREFFTFRPQKTTQRSALDLHNMTGVVALPFHFFFAFPGLVIFAGIYFPVSHTQLEPLHELHEKVEAQETGLPHDRTGVAAPLASVDAMVAEAQRRWAAQGMAGEVGFLALQHVGDTNGYVSIYRAGTDRIALVGNGIHFKASTGELLREDPAKSAVDGVNEFLTGLHLQHFRHWLLRWLYVLGGLAGCVCIATGFLFFVEKRKKQHARAGSQGARVVDALAVTTVTGMLIAALGILIANRLPPEALPAGWRPRGELEQYAFWAAWVLAMAHAFWRSTPVAQCRMAPAWREQSWAIAAMAVVVAVLNWVTTGDHLLKTLGAGYWPVAGGICSSSPAPRWLWWPRASWGGAPGWCLPRASRRRPMRDALLLAAAMLAATAGMGWLALDVHWEQVRGADPLAPSTARLLHALGALGLAASLALCLTVDHASMASLVWVMALAAAALAVAFTLTWRPRWLGPLVVWRGLVRSVK